MNQELLQRVIDNPGDDAPRLIYADWLEENGEAERGEFIRVQIELAKTTEVNRAAVINSTAIECKHGYDVCPICDANPRYTALRARERELGPSYKWIECLPGVFTGGGMNMIIKYGHDGRGMDYHFARGFVEKVRLRWDQWLTHHKAIRAATPLTRCELTTDPPLYVDPELVGYQPCKCWMIEGGKVDVWAVHETHEVVLMRLLKAEFPGIAFAFVFVGDGGTITITGGAGNFAAHGGAVTIQG